MKRKWIAVEKNETYAKDSELRFQGNKELDKANGQAFLFDMADTRRT